MRVTAFPCPFHELQYVANLVHMVKVVCMPVSSYINYVPVYMACIYINKCLYHAATLHVHTLQLQQVICLCGTAMSAVIIKQGACVYGRAGVTPFLAAHLHGYNNFKWMLYGDDDTVFFIDNALDMLEGLDHNMPYFLTDHLWFPDQFGNSPSPAMHVC